ncbi:mitotic checkpoint protein BUB3 [Arthroderma uncinatum]|uniref:mitotic checkpoint protein BUB3 n=1 Tax=Arthroderma uncinatum TaxID=74035 RepID=UPI00144A4D51|nr:mitotic checkpoint protein BUB3 [Arthroderma uncinatum]KAF3490857.1 mitotic checkpoint protein BUB3 [Arthroderma uncinatum]
MASNHFAVSNPPTDVISAVQFSPEPDSTRFVVSSWDKNVYLYDLRDENGNIGEGKLIDKFEHRAPVLDVCFGQNEDELYTGGLDWDVRKLVPDAEVDVSNYSQGVKSVVYSKEHGLVVSASWDVTLHIHKADGSSAPATIPLPSKPFSLSVTPTKLVVAMASRTLHIYDLKSLTTFLEQSGSQPPAHTLELEPWQRRESSLKFMTRAVACMPDDAGSNGKYLLVGISPGFEDEKDDVPEGSVKVMIRELSETEAKGKGAK